MDWSNLMCVCTWKSERAATWHFKLCHETHTAIWFIWPLGPSHSVPFQSERQSFWMELSRHVHATFHHFIFRFAVQEKHFYPLRHFYDKQAYTLKNESTYKHSKIQNIKLKYDTAGKKSFQQKTKC